MAKVAFSAIIAGARGKLAGVVFSANASGPYIKSWARSPRKDSASLNVVRGAMSSHATYWWALSQAQRDDWQTWSQLPAQELTDALGEAYYVSGWNWFVTLNQRLELMGRSRRSVYPSSVKPPQPTLTSAAVSTASDGTLTLVYPTDEWLAYDLVVSMSLVANQGRAAGFLANALTVILEQSPVHATTESVTDLEDLFGSIDAGMRAFVWAARQDAQGRRSPWVSTYADVT